MAEQTYLPWDPSRPWSEQNLANFWNGGCPPGYFASFVSPTWVSTDGIEPYDYGNPNARVVCRLAATSTPQTIVDDSATTWLDTMNNFNDAVKQTLSDFGKNVASGVGMSIPWLLIAVAALFFINSRQR